MTEDKELYLIRHGLTEMNQYMYSFFDDPENRKVKKPFKDPMFYDTVLNEIGRNQASSLANITKNLKPKPEVILVSPLTRTLQTCEFAFAKSKEIKREVTPLLRERLYYSSDVGTNPKILQQHWPQHDFSKLEDIWWFNGNNSDPKWVLTEPMGLFISRVKEFRDYLANRPEKVIACVTHHGLLHELTGKGFNNCELVNFKLSQLMPNTTQSH